MRATCATIHLGALRENLRRVRELAPGARVLAVVKADGYGHGLERVARALEGADAFGVAGIADGQRLRAAGVSQRIVVLSGHDEPADLAELRRLRLDTVVHTDAQVEMLAADPDPRPLRVFVDDGIELEATQFGEIARLVRAGQHDDALRRAGRAQALAVGDAGDAERIGAFERARDALQTVAVAVGLDHRHDLRARREFAHAAQVLAQRAEVDRGAGRAHQGEAGNGE